MLMALLARQQTRKGPTARTSQTRCWCSTANDRTTPYATMTTTMALTLTALEVGSLVLVHLGASKSRGQLDGWRSVDYHYRLEAITPNAQYPASARIFHSNSAARRIQFSTTAPECQDPSVYMLARKAAPPNRAAAPMAPVGPAKAAAAAFEDEVTPGVVVAAVLGTTLL